MTATLSITRKQKWVSWFLWDDHYKWISSVTNVWHALKKHRCSMVISAVHMQNFQPFTGYGDVSISVKNSRVGQKTVNKQKINPNFVFWLHKKRHHHRNTTLFWRKQHKNAILSCFTYVLTLITLVITTDVQSVLRWFFMKQKAAMLNQRKGLHKYWR